MVFLQKNCVLYSASAPPRQMTRKGAACAGGEAWGIQTNVPGERICTDDLPSVSVARLRGRDVITAETVEYAVRLGDVEQTVSLALIRFPSGGSWSRFVAPCCGRKVQVLRAFNGRLLCRQCLCARGVFYRADLMSVKQRAERRAPKLRAMLESKEPLRLKPSTLWGTMERRSRLEARLRECEFRVAVRSRLRKAETIDDPCEEPDFSALRPRTPV